MHRNADERISRRSVSRLAWKEDLERWFDALPKPLDEAWVSKRDSPEAIVIRISTEYPVDQEYSAVFRFWLATSGAVDRVQFYHEGARKEANSERSAAP